MTAKAELADSAPVNAMVADEIRNTRVHLIAAVAANGVIGAGNRMPWHLPEDLRNFKALTLGHPVIMGRKTFDSLPGRKLLPGRRNIVVSRTSGLEIPGASVAASFEDALALCAGESVVYVIGGGELYKAALPLVEELVMTEIGQDYAGDTRFPAWDRNLFRETRRTPNVSVNGTPFAFVHYERIRPADD